MLLVEPLQLGFSFWNLKEQAQHVAWDFLLYPVVSREPPCNLLGQLRAGRLCWERAVRSAWSVPALSECARLLPLRPQCPPLPFQVHVRGGEPRLHRGVQVPDRHCPISFVVGVTVQCLTGTAGYLGAKILKRQASFSPAFS